MKHRVRKFIGTLKVGLPHPLFTGIAFKIKLRIYTPSENLTDQKLIIAQSSRLTKQNFAFHITSAPPAFLSSLDNSNVMNKTQEGLTALEAKTDATAKLIKSSNQALMQEAKRFQDLLALYQTQAKASDGIFSRTKLNQNSFRETEEYSKLINSQIVPRLNELHTRASALKLHISKSIPKAAAKEDEHVQKLEEFRKEVDGLERAWLDIWNEESFLMLNYRMDICAKEVERWTEVMGSAQTKEKDIGDRVDAVFK